MAIISILAAIAIPDYFSNLDKAKIASAAGDIKNLESQIKEYKIETGSYPASLKDIRSDGFKDPWGNPYEYWPVTGDQKQKVRKDRNTHPINTDFDLYSKGKDGRTNFALTAKASHDDVIRASNGSYIGLASKY
jgi:general secretion pathway protein G